ncbi:MAG: serine/threonine protein phosphatase [Proteobacteria bacterium]|nr:serine/threonine protein phosphatase [Pseudomonadota bacterium]
MGDARQAAGSPYSLPPGTRVYAVGDIHGRADLLDRLHDQIRADAAARPATRRVVVYLGDYLDRGPASRAVVDRLLCGPLPGFEAVYLKGNHEDFLTAFLDDSSIGFAWIMNGAAATFASYGVELSPALLFAGGFEAARARLLAAIEGPHLTFFRALRLFHEEGGYAFVHAGIRPGVPLASQSGHDLLWIREEFLFSSADHGRRVVHGHTITPEPEVRPNRIGIDTGAFMTGRLTALVLDGEGLRFLST